MPAPQAAGVMADMLPLLLALAQGPRAVEPPPPPVGEVTVYANRPPPALARTYPAAGAVAPFGVLVLTVAFDQLMDPASVEAAFAGPDAPDCLGRWRLLADKRTYVRLCSLQAGKSYRIRFADDGAKTFHSVLSKPPAPFDLAFTTEPDKTDASLADAIKSAGLKPEDGPVMDWRAPVAAP